MSSRASASESVTPGRHPNGTRATGANVGTPNRFGERDDRPLIQLDHRQGLHLQPQAQLEVDDSLRRHNQHAVSETDFDTFASQGGQPRAAWAEETARPTTSLEGRSRGVTNAVYDLGSEIPAFASAQSAPYDLASESSGAPVLHPASPAVYSMGQSSAELEARHTYTLAQGDIVASHGNASTGHYEQLANTYDMGREPSEDTLVVGGLYDAATLSDAPDLDSYAKPYAYTYAPGVKPGAGNPFARDHSYEYNDSDNDASRRYSELGQPQYAHHNPPNLVPESRPGQGIESTPRQESGYLDIVPQPSTSTDILPVRMPGKLA